jgi:hypothetical protein
MSTSLGSTFFMTIRVAVLSGSGAGGPVKISKKVDFLNQAKAGHGGLRLICPVPHLVQIWFAPK